MSVRFGAGKHLAAVPKEDVVPFYKTTFYAVPTLQLVAVTLPKMAVLDLYLHIFIDRWSRLTIRLLQVVLMVNLIVNEAVVISQCQPVAALWDPNILGGWCHDIQQHFFWVALPNIVTDVVILILPIPLIRKVQVSRNVKTGMFLTFLVGNL